MSSSFFWGFPPVFNLLSLLAGGVFLLAFAVIIMQLVRGAARCRRNNRSPVLTVEAVVVTRRSEVHRLHSADGLHPAASHRYYATFEVESGDRMELALSGSEYGLLAEGDRGRLCFQGTRYLGFERQTD